MVYSFVKPPSRINVVLSNVSVGICEEQQSLRRTCATEEIVEVRSMYPTIQSRESCLTYHNVQFEVVNRGFVRCKKASAQLNCLTSLLG